MPLHRLYFKDFHKYFAKDVDTVFFFDDGLNPNNKKIKKQIDKLMPTLKKVHFVELNLSSCLEYWKKSFYRDPNMFFYTKKGIVYDNKLKPTDDEIRKCFKSKD